MIDNTILYLKTAIYSEDNKFSEAQKKELSTILNSIDRNCFSNLSPLKIAKNMRTYKDTQNKFNNFEKLYFNFGGKKELIEDAPKQLINNLLKIVGVKI